ncbi:hypothetical protein VUR80DRAFT_129 [Thermomyces stellatus]
MVNPNMYPEGLNRPDACMSYVLHFGRSGRPIRVDLLFPFGGQFQVEAGAHGCLDGGKIAVRDGRRPERGTERLERIMLASMRTPDFLLPAIFATTGLSRSIAHPLIQFLESFWLRASTHPWVHGKARMKQRQWGLGGRREGGGLGSLHKRGCLNP